MKLTADEQGRLASAELFRQLAQVPVAKRRRVNGRLRSADVRLSRETVAAALRAERDAR